MKVHEAISTALDSLTVKRVFGEPYDVDGVTVIPAAWVVGGAGGGAGQDEQGQEGEGGGMGLSARPAGAYVVTRGEVRWRPAYDINRIVSTVGAAVIVYLLSRPRLVRARSKAVPG